MHALAKEYVHVHVHVTCIRILIITVTGSRRDTRRLVPATKWTLKQSPFPKRGRVWLVLYYMYLMVPLYQPCTPPADSG